MTGRSACRMPGAPGGAGNRQAYRLARNARFLRHVVEGTGSVGKSFLTQMAAATELKARLISQHTCAALATAKARGTVPGNPRLRVGTPDQARGADVLPYLDTVRRAGACTLHELAEVLTNRGVPTPAGKDRWQAEQAGRVLAYSP